jgi:DNA topoisomerase 2-associated protein PAT1
MSFFGFDSALPERRDGPGQGQGRPQQDYGRGQGQFATNNDTAFGLSGGAGEEEDLAVYTWGENMGGGLLEGGDDFNDETFGDVGNFGKSYSCQGYPSYARLVLIYPGEDFQFAAPAAPTYNSNTNKSGKPKGPIASTQSRYGPRAAYDPFAVSEDDFYSSRPAS